VSPVAGGALSFAFAVSVRQYVSTATLSYESDRLGAVADRQEGSSANSADRSRVLLATAKLEQSSATRSQTVPDDARPSPSRSCARSCG